ncbi:hypothetical protein EC973_003305 [Apophysomyces ossiformis]|uniref:Proteasome component ECM29 n=1 Tax=Apophysomyces ossiformis TaxID=679940 RepID=A0A8H7BTT1_9FUNG|nr:hypothetical protein EC973_003305 [Apophysomyces ossiformis]
MTSNELELLENVELKLAMCTSDAQLERTVGVFLPPVLLKLSSNNELARKKVMDILSHINKRVKPNLSIKLPFNNLLSQFTDAGVSGFVKNFTLIYLEMCVARMTPEEIANHVPSFLRGIAGRPAPQRLTLLQMTIPVLAKLKLSDDQEIAKRDVFGFNDSPQDVSIILNFFLDVLLYQPSARQAAQHPTDMPRGRVYSGLSKAAVEDINNKGKADWSGNRLTEAKLGIVRFLLTPAFTDNERLRLLIAGVCDINHQVISLCEDGLRRHTSNVDLENAQLLQSLYTLYLGTKAKTGSDNENVRAPASNAIKIRILQYLNKSVAATNMITQMIQVVFDGIYGEESNMKLRRSTMSYLQWTARMCDSAKIAPVAPILVSGLLKYIDQNSEVNGHVPKIALDDTEILSKFFDHLEKEKPNVRVYIQDALSSMIEIYIDLNESSSIYDQLADIILNAVQKNNPNSRFMALKYANAIYPYSSVFARYVCLLATSSSIVKLEVNEESKRGLHPFVRSASGFIGSTQDIVPPSMLPKFIDLVKYVTEHRPNEQYTLDSKTPCIKGYPVEVYSEILSFIRMILILESNPTTILIDEYVESKVENNMSEDPVTMENFKSFVNDAWLGSSTENREALEQWLQLIENALDKNLKDTILMSTASRCLLEMISLGPASISTTFKPKLSFFKGLAISEKVATHTIMSRIFGIIASDETVTQVEVEELLTELCNLLEAEVKHHGNGSIEQKHGVILTVGYLLSRCNYRNRSLSSDLIRRCIKNLSSYLDSPSTIQYSLAGAAAQALGDIGRTKMLPLPSEKRKSEEVVEQPDSSADNLMDVDSKHAPAAQGVIERLAKLAKTCKDAKVQEKAIIALGDLSVPLPAESALTDVIIDALFASADTKQIELFFAGGEAWAALGFGWGSLAMHKHKDLSRMDVLDCLDETTVKDVLFQRVIEKIVKSYVTSDRSWYRKASCIWLLSILKFGKGQELIQSNLSMLHASFSRLLGDQDDFTQEVASKGLGLVYEYGDAKLKEDMLYSLVGTFSEGRSIQAQSVTDNTVLFEEGALGTTPEGSTITTYKELCSLASELNQPDLIYKFMHLANHNAAWASRRGAAFGFQNLMALAEKEMEPYLPRLIPKLYRYQFDPNSRVNQSMKTIWRSLVKDHQKTVDTYFNEIMDDLLKGLGNQQWRVREASCVAITDIVHGRQLSQIQPYLEELWRMCFRALDDIKGSVRQAATQTCKSLTKLTVHYCDPNVVSAADGSKVIDIVMPFLLQKGIVSDAEDVQKFSLDAVLRVCKTGAALLKPYVPDIIETLLESLSCMYETTTNAFIDCVLLALEPQAMNYLSFHVERYNISQEQLDNARLSGAKNSPMMEGIEHCVNQIDEKVMEDLTPRIINLVKKGTGLPTKAGCARFIVTLCMNRRAIFQPHADSVMKALTGAIRSRNPVIRKSYATAVGYVCQLVTFDRRVSLIRYLKKLYISEEDEDARVASAVTAIEITRFAADAVKAVASDIVPLIYLGEHDPDESLNKLWKDAWENLTSGTRSMVLLYTDEIITFVQPLLTSPSWKVKQTAALTIADMCKSANSSVSKHADKLMPVMVSTLATRSWDGKEHVLEAFVQLCISAKSYFEESKEPSLEEVVKILVREAKRRNRTYQRHALVSLKAFADAFGDKIDMYEQVHEFLTDVCNMDEIAAAEDEENENAKPLILMIKANAFKAIVAGFRPKTFVHQGERFFRYTDKK